VTIDAALRYQQNLAEVPMIIVLLAAPSNRLAELLPLMPVALRQLAEATPGQIVRAL